MPGIVFSTTNSGINETNNALIGRYEMPVRMIIQNESDMCAKNDDLVKALFEVHKSNRFGESIITDNEFDIFTPVAEGGAAPGVTYKEVASKDVKHTTFKSQFRITTEMMEDSNINQITVRAQKHTRSYYRTCNMFASALYTGAFGGADGSKKTVAFGSQTGTQNFDITTADGVALFSAQHAVSPNRNHYVLTGAIDTSLIEAALSAAVDRIRNMKDANGYSMGYTADTIVIPADDPALETAVKKVLGSQFSNGTNGLLSGSISLHYGNWTLIVDPLWTRTVKTTHPMMILSSEARRNLQGAVFFDRKPLTISAHVDQETDDYIWNGAARMSGAFTSHKFAYMIELLDKGTTGLIDGGVAGTSEESTAVSL